jgi:hypothetical protein
VRCPTFGELAPVSQNLLGRDALEATLNDMGNPLFVGFLLWQDQPPEILHSPALGKISCTEEKRNADKRVARTIVTVEVPTFLLAACCGAKYSHPYATLTS